MSSPKYAPVVLMPASADSTLQSTPEGRVPRFSADRTRRPTPTGGASSGHRAPKVAGSRRVSGAQALLGLLALVCLALVFARLIERWQVTPATASHHVLVLGQPLSYPAANAAALLVLGLALFGAIVVAIAVIAAVREVTATRRLTRRLATAEPLPGASAFVIAGERPQAFCAGLIRPRVYVSDGALALLDDAALETVLAHERHHARRRDPLRLVVGRVFTRALFFLPGLNELARRREALAEISADQAAVATGPEGRPALARAMLSFSDSPGADAGVGIDPVRVDHLLGEPPAWRFPAATFVGALLVLGLLAAIALLAGREAAGSASLAPPFLSAQPCVVVLALIPAALALVGIAVAQRTRLPAAMRQAARD